jgi:hypothetical protein
MYFDGVNDLLTVRPISQNVGGLILSAEMSIAMWVYQESGGAATQDLVAKIDHT